MMRACFWVEVIEDWARYATDEWRAKKDREAWERGDAGASTMTTRKRKDDTSSLNIESWNVPPAFRGVDCGEKPSRDLHGMGC